MTATYGFSRTQVTVTEPDGGPVHSYEALSVTVRGGRGRLRHSSGKLISEKVGVVSSRRVAANHWLTTFTDGTTWEVVVDKRGCSSCGH